MPDQAYTVTQVLGRIIIDRGGNPVRGYHIDFLTKRGMRGYVEIPADQYNADAGRAALATEAARLDEILGL